MAKLKNASIMVDEITYKKFKLICIKNNMSISECLRKYMTSQVNKYADDGIFDDIKETEIKQELDELNKILSKKESLEKELEAIEKRREIAEKNPKPDENSVEWESIISAVKTYNSKVKGSGFNSLQDPTFKEAVKNLCNNKKADFDVVYSWLLDNESEFNSIT